MDVNADQPAQDDRAIAQRAPGSVVECEISSEAESYNRTVRGLDIQAIRAGPSSEPSRVVSVVEPRFMFNWNRIGFPMLARATVADDYFAIGYVRAPSPGSRWCEIELRPHDVVIEGSGCAHTSRNLPGLDFMFVVAAWETIESQADQLGLGVDRVAPGKAMSLDELSTSAMARSAVVSALCRYGRAAADGNAPSAASGDAVVRALAHCLGDIDPVRRIRPRHVVESRRVVHRCIDYAESVGRAPSIGELCIAGQVSERRLRDAFTDEYDIPPSQFFRAWALEQAHRRLRRADRGDATVTEVAVGLGFGHLGRFSEHYRRTFGEVPSSTLRED